MSEAVEDRVRTGPSRRTRKERDAINARCAAFLRPRQVEALAALERACRGGARHFVKSVAGWHAPTPAGSATAFAPSTMEALRRRGLAKRWRDAMIITAAGRRELRNYR